MRRLITAALMLASPLAWSAPPSTATVAPSEQREVASIEPWVDVQLGDLDRYAARYAMPFEDELVRYQDAPRDLIADLRQKGWRYSRIYAACVIARTAGRPCRYVADAWTGNPPQRWDAVAAGFGVSAGSDAVQRIQGAITQTYVRLGRPLASQQQTD